MSTAPKSAARSLSRGSCVYLATLLITIMLVSRSHAHRAHHTLTSVAWNSNTYAIEVIHRLHIQDAVRALQKRHATAHLSLQPVRNQALLALYVENHFSLSVENKTPATLDMVGVEFAGDEVLVYQELRLEDPPAEVSISCTLFQEVFDTQVNQVNVSIPGSVQTLMFDKTGALP